MLGTGLTSGVAYLVRSTGLARLVGTTGGACRRSGLRGREVMVSRVVTWWRSVRLSSTAVLLERWDCEPDGMRLCWEPPGAFCGDCDCRPSLSVLLAPPPNVEARRALELITFSPLVVVLLSLIVAALWFEEEDIIRLSRSHLKSLKCVAFHGENSSALSFPSLALLVDAWGRPDTRLAGSLNLGCMPRST